jgi:TadE-like protein
LGIASTMFGITRNSRSCARGFIRFRKLRAFRREEDGVAAVEFGIVALPFFGLLFAILETAIVFLASQTLETAVADSARLILTGQAQTESLTAETFRDKVCGRIYGIFDCKNEEKMSIDVRKYADFSAVDLTRPVDDEGKVKPGAYDPGGPCEIVVVRLIYQFPIHVSLTALADMAGSKRLIVATSVFRNEPFQGTCS